MRVQDVVKTIMRANGVTQQQLAEKFGKAGQSTISMILNGRSMKVENLLKILDECGYELVFRSRDGSQPEYVIGDVQSERIVVKPIDEDQIRDMIEKAVADKIKEVRKYDRAVAHKKELEERPNDIKAGKVKLPGID